MPIYLQYYFWLVLVSLLCLVLERIKPWRPKQEVIREGFVQDLFWLVFNQQYVGWMLALGAVKLVSLLDETFLKIGFPAASDFRLIESWPLLGQILFAFTLRDFLAWIIHVLLHRVNWMWEFHKLHHCITELDWLGTYRSHWGEMVIFKVITFIPIVLLGADDFAIFVVSVISILIHSLSHSNLRYDWGVLRYLINSPRFHSWHHDLKMYGKGGQNFWGNLVIWDWLFGTAYYPKDREQPDEYGFHGMNRYPKTLWGRLLHPSVKLKK